MRGAAEGDRATHERRRRVVQRSSHVYARINGLPAEVRGLASKAQLQRAALAGGVAERNRLRIKDRAEGDRAQPSIGKDSLEQHRTITRCTTTGIIAHVGHHHRSLLCLRPHQGIG
jgi:hypothetical protein